MDSMNNSNVDPNNNIVRNWLGVIAAALVLAVLITYMIHRNDNLSPIASDTGTSTATTTNIIGSALSTSTGAFATLPDTMTTATMGEAVTVPDQPAGTKVAIASMTLTRRSWVAIKDMNGSILGAGLFPASATSGSVPLLRRTEAGKRYEVLIYVDDGDKRFDLHKDMLVTDTDGSPVSSTFIAQ